MTTTHTAQRIEAGHYRYRGVYIERHTNEYGTDWHAYDYRDGSDGYIIEPRPTLTEARAAIDRVLGD